MSEVNCDLVRDFQDMRKRAEAAESRVKELEAHNQQLTGEPFSERNHGAPQEKGTSPPAQSASLPSTTKSPEPGSPDSGSCPASAANPGAGTPPADS